MTPNFTHEEYVLSKLPSWRVFYQRKVGDLEDRDNNRMPMDAELITKGMGRYYMAIGVTTFAYVEALLGGGHHMADQNHPPVQKMERKHGT
jgi:hypothetical protein